MTLVGMSNSTGRALDGLDHLRQSVRDILLTPIGSRVMRRDYGSALADLIDANITDLTMAQIYAASIDALRKWEPRLRITRIQGDVIPEELEAGRIELTFYADYLPDGQEITLDGVIL